MRGKLNKSSLGLMWSAIERFSVQGMQFIIQLILARLLMPTDYGLIGMLVIFLAIAQAIADGGFSTALIQKKDRKEEDFSTAFIFNIVIGLGIYGILFLIAPLIAKFYKQDELIILTRIISLNVVLISLSVVQSAILSIKIDFKTKAKASFLAVLISGITGILFAYFGFGVWALVIQSILNNLINTIGLWYLAKWRPSFVFCRSAFNEMFGFGSKILISSVLSAVFLNVYTIIIGKLYCAKELGYFTRADQFKQFPSTNITSIIQRVVFPLMSEVQDSNEKLRIIFLKFVRLTAFIVFPLMSGMAIIAEDMILLLLTEKWLPVVPMLQILCVSGILYPINVLNLNVLTAKGLSSLYLKLDLLRKIITVLAIILTYRFGIHILIVGQVGANIVALMINIFYTKKIIFVGYREQIKNIGAIFLVTLSMMIIVYIVTKVTTNPLTSILTSFLIGGGFYVGISFLLDIAGISQFYNLLFKR